MSRPFKLQTTYKIAGDQGPAIDSLVQGLNDGLAFQTLLGVTGSGKTFTMANIIDQLQRPALVLAPNKTLAAQLYGEMKMFFPDNAVEYFVSYYDYYQPEAYVPASDTFIEKDASINDHIEQMRLSTTKAILEREDTIIVASVSAIYGLGDPQSYLKMVLHLNIGDKMPQRRLLRRLAELQYTRNDVELSRACYRVRGDIIDIFPAESDRKAIRIELFDDHIEALSEFDPLSGHIIEKMPRFTLYPKTHYVTSRQTLLNSVDNIRSELSERLAELRNANKLVEAQRLQQRTQFDLEMILEIGYCNGIENYSRYLSLRGAGQAPPTLMDYLPPHSLLFIDESHVTVSQIGGMYRGDRSRKETLVAYGFRLPSALDNRPLRFDEFTDLIPQTVFVSATPRIYEREISSNIAEQIIRPTGLLDPEVVIRPVDSQVDDLMSEIQTHARRGDRVLATTLTKRMAEDLTEYLDEHHVRARYLHSDINTLERMEIIRDLRNGEFDALVGINLLREGLDMPEVALVAVLDADKEGFLRSTTALIQTMGRAARNIRGKVILYANKVTNSMRQAMDETTRRRAIQQAFNEKHGIIPQGITKQVNDTLQSGYERKNQKKHRGSAPQLLSAEIKTAYDAASPKKLSKELKRLEECMHQHARDLEFEEAAALRDQIQEVLLRIP